MKQILSKLLRNEELTQQETKPVMLNITEEKYPATQIASMLSMIQMPGDIPVATVGVGSGGAKNAGILAVEILALSDPALLEKLNQYRVKIAEKVNAMDEKLQETVKEELG